MLITASSIGMLALQAVLCVWLTVKYSLTGTAASTLIAAGMGMLLTGAFTAKIFGVFWQKKHTLLLLLNMAVYVVYLLLFRNIQISGFFILVAICAVAYLIPAVVGAGTSGYLKKVSTFMAGKKK